MQVFTEQEAKQFLEEHDLGEKLTHLDPDRSRCEYDVNLSRRCVYANMLTNHLITGESSIACLDITDWAVWPAGQNMDLIYSYRHSLGETRFLIDAHFHVFKATEAREFRNILHLSLLSMFDIAGASTTTDFRFYASHDDWVEVSWYEDASWRPTMNWLFSD